MTKVKIKGEDHSSSDDLETFEKALESDNWDLVLREDRELMKVNGSPILYILNYIIEFIYKVASYIQTETDLEIDNYNYSYLEDRIDEIYQDFSYIQRGQLIVYPILFIYIILSLTNTPIVASTVILSLIAYLPLFGITFFVIGNWYREKRMAKNIIEETEKNDKIYVQLGSIHFNSVKNMVEDSIGEIEKERTSTRFLLTTTFFSIIFRIATPYRSMKNFRRYYI